MIEKCRWLNIDMFMLAYKQAKTQTVPLEATRLACA